ncbi:MAG: bifunctional enoyl-CoA hydratase/phosphate acetyltransferase [Betaproteobacteria bacterium]
MAAVSAVPAPRPLASHPRLDALVASARECAASAPPALGLVHPCDTLALQAAARIAAAGIARPLLVGPKEAILAAADAAGIDARYFEIAATGPAAPESAQRAVALARGGALAALMKGSLHTDELMSAVVARNTGLRGERRISHAFVFDLPRYHKPIALADCVVNIAPNLATKRDILGNAIELLQRLGVARPKVGIVAAVETVNTAIPATLDAQALVAMARDGAWPGATVEGPFGFDNAFSAEAARVKKIESAVAGDADLLVVPDLNAGNMLYKSFVYVGGGECAGLVLGARVPVVLTSRADTLAARLASVALAVLAAHRH